ncbi:MAG: DUF4139 domain-containing protein [Bacteroidota bacterium]|nr:DUF4139 domain-containing protein [Bacteroidota bacterium]
MKKNILALLLMASPLFAQEAKRESIALTVYNSNLGVVRDVRLFDLKKGQSEVKLLDVPSRIDPTTVKITALKHPKDIGILEQNFEYDLVNQEKLLEKYIDKQITLTDDKGNRTDGTLLSSSGSQITLSSPTGILMFPNTNQYRISVPNLPEGLITKPTLIWNVKSNSALNQEPLEVLYQTQGISWHAEYIVALADDDKSLDLTGWVSIDNKCGATFENAKLKLVAGKLNRVPPPGYAGNFAITPGLMGEMDAKSFQERGLFEYHIYDLGRTTTIKDNEVKQLSLLEASKVKSEKTYTYRGQRNAEVTIKFENTEKNNMGMPLPEGIVRVMKKDKDGSFEFVGEDRIEHTPRDEKITLKVGDAFDLLGEKTVTDSKSTSHSSRETIQITLKNRKDEDVTIDALEDVGESWEIIKSSMDYEKKSSSEIIFHVPVKARSEQKVEYTILHTW